MHPGILMRHDAVMQILTDRHSAEINLTTDRVKIYQCVVYSEHIHCFFQK